MTKMGVHIRLAMMCLLGLMAASCAARDRFAAIAPAMQRFVDRDQVKGIVTLVATRDRIVHQAAVGTTDGKRAMRTSDLFWIASMSKPMTVVCTAMLVEEGKLRYDDPVARYIPEFADLTLDGAPLRRPVLVRDLLNHTSGLPYNYTRTQPRWNLEQYVRQIVSQPMEFGPGEDWYYSNAGIDAVGLIVQRASGMPFDEFLQKRLLDPLAMKDTTFWIRPQDLPRVARAYAPNEDGKGLHEVAFAGLYGTALPDRQRPPLGAAGLFSTAEDVAKFYQMMLNRGMANGKVILKPETVALLTRDQIAPLDAGGGLGWGYGFCVVRDPGGMEADRMLAPGTFGHVGLYGTNSWADPTRGVIYVLLLERDELEYLDSPMRREFQTLAAQALDQK